MAFPDARPADGYAGDITPREAWDLLADDAGAVLVDVRTEGEWTTIGVPDVSPLGKQATFAPWVTPFGPNPAFLDEVRAAGLAAGDERPVVFLCRSGQRSIAAARAATAAGLGPAYNVLDGFEGDVGLDGRRGHTGWQAEGLAATAWPPAAGPAASSETDGARA